MDFDVGTGKEARESELPALEQLVALGYRYEKKSEINKHREKFSEVILYDRLEEAIKKLNPDINNDGVCQALSQLEEANFPHDLPVVDTNEKIRAMLVGISRSSGLSPVVIIQNGVHKTLKIFDFDDVENNDFLVTNQFEIHGFRRPIFPDIVIFVNGIPLVIIECKDPTIPRPLEQAHEKNFTRYQKSQNGFERLFFYNHAMIATSGNFARVGTLQSDINHYARWSDPYPYSLDDVRAMSNGKAREQEILIAGLLSKENLLNHIKNFVIYEVNNNQKRKKIAKYQQFRVVTKSISKIMNQDTNNDKGGVIWHTQGSGKSLSMVWFASQLIPKLKNPPMVIITDRKQLDKQIHETFKNTGFSSPMRATNSRHLGDLLSNPRGKTIMTTIDKFSNVEINTNERIICMVDEAHRSQFKIKAEQMRITMPNAIFFGFTGTPIDKEDKNTYRVFGPLLDKYGFKESQDDGSTLPILYEGRMPKLYIEGGDTIEQLYDRIIGQDPLIDKPTNENLKNRYITKEKIAEAPSRIRQITLDLLDHYKKHIEPNGYKAMIVAQSREAAVIYKKELDKINAPPSKIIMTSEPGESGKDGSDWDEYHLNPKEREEEAERFKSAEDPTKILIVVDMLLVGYDVPICQVLYLDKSIKEHNLLQAIARVNRPYDQAKKYGLVVDYFGITLDMQKALEMFNKNDIEHALDSRKDMLELLDKRHKDILKYFDDVDRKNYDTIIEKFEAEDIRQKFMYDFKMFTHVLDIILPDKEADPYLNDFRFAGEVRQLLYTRYGPNGLSLTPYGKKIQKLIDAHIRSLGISNLIDPMEINHENFLIFIKNNIKSERAKAALIKTRAISIIKEEMPNNPNFYEPLYKKLMRVICEETERRKTNVDYFISHKIYEEIYIQALSEKEERQKVFGKYDANDFEFAVYSLLCDTKEKDESIKLTKTIYKTIKPETEIIGFKEKISVEKNIRSILDDILTKSGLNDIEITEISDKIINLVRRNL